MFDEAVVEMGDGNLVRLPELTARLGVGEKGTVRNRFVPHVATIDIYLAHSSCSYAWDAQSFRSLAW